MDRVSEYEREDYPGMVTPTELRNLALGIENCNHDAEQIAAMYYEAGTIRRAINRLIDRGSPVGRDLMAILGHRHVHVADPKLGDECAVCGRDLRNSVHKRATENAA